MGQAEAVNASHFHPSPIFMGKYVVATVSYFNPSLIFVGKAEVVIDSHLHPSLIFVGKGWSLALEQSTFRNSTRIGSSLACKTIRLGWKGMRVTNTVTFNK
jgi:hypothetical protein